MAREAPQLLNQLPSVFQVADGEGDTFMRRFLQIFEAVFGDLQRELDAIPDLFDLAKVSGLVGAPLQGGVTSPTYPARHDVIDVIPPSRADELRLLRERRANVFLAWLAGWLGQSCRHDKDPRWNADFIRTAIRLIPKRGTLEGLVELLKAYLKDDVTDVELSDAGGFIVGVSRLGIDSLLNDAGNPLYSFTVTLHGVSERTAAAKSRLAHQLLEREVPAHSAYQIVCTAL